MLTQFEAYILIPSRVLNGFWMAFFWFKILQILFAALMVLRRNNNPIVYFVIINRRLLFHIQKKNELFINKASTQNHLKRINLPCVKRALIREASSFDLIDKNNKNQRIHIVHTK